MPASSMANAMQSLENLDGQLLVYRVLTTEISLLSHMGEGEFRVIGGVLRAVYVVIGVLES
jgi:hypothetical protein